MFIAAQRNAKNFSRVPLPRPVFFGIVCPTHAPERRARVKAEADDLHREYVLSQIRQQVSFTQADVAETRL